MWFVTSLDMPAKSPLLGISTIVPPPHGAFPGVLVADEDKCGIDCGVGQDPAEQAEPATLAPAVRRAAALGRAHALDEAPDERQLQVPLPRPFIAWT